MAREDEQESFGAKPSSDQEPSHSWDLGRLGQYARTQHEAILQGERTLAPRYWRLSQALHLARKQIKRGDWGRYLEELGVHKVRAAKARAIFRTFSTPQAVEGLSVEEAYEQRERRQACAQQKALLHKAWGDQSDEGTLKLASFLLKVCDRAEELVDVAAHITEDRRTELLPMLRWAIEKLEHLGQELGCEK